MPTGRICEVILTNTTLNHRKVYKVWLEQLGGRFHVRFAYGRIGQALREGCKTAAPVPRATADALRGDLVHSKEGRGYVRCTPPVMTAPVQGRATAAGARPTRLTRPVANQKPVEIAVNRSGRVTVSF
jgi:hypothetical protein